MAGGPTPEYVASYCLSGGRGSLKTAVGSRLCSPPGLLFSLGVQLQRNEPAMGGGLSQEMGLRMLGEHCILGGGLIPIPSFD